MIAIEILTVNPLYILHDTNCISVGKRARKERKETYQEAKDYYIKEFIKEHSSIEWVDFRIVDVDSRGDIASHFVRHCKGHPRFIVQSSRPDWNNGEPRKPLDKTDVMFTSKWTAYSFIQMARQRLCSRASKVDRDILKEVLTLMRDSGDPYFSALSFCCVPNCIYRGGCPEEKECSNVDFFYTGVSFSNIKKRYYDFECFYPSVKYNGE